MEIGFDYNYLMKGRLTGSDCFRFVINMAISSPNDLRLLFERYFPERVQGCEGPSITKREVREQLPWLLRLIKRFRKAKVEKDTAGQSRVREELNSKVDEMDEFIGHFVNLCVETFCNEEDPHILERELRRNEIRGNVDDFYGNGLFDSIIYLYQTSSEDTKKRFARHFLTSTEMAHFSNVFIIVKKEDDIRKIRGNTGRYVIYTGKYDHHPPKLLKFTHQASTVYYLMYLIDRHNNPYKSNHISLAANKDEFMRLYHKVYDISQDDLENRFQSLLYREELGFLRSGREKELSYDIRKSMWKRFSEEYDENPSPYVIEAKGHLSIDPEHILFEEDDLLDFHFH